jgi:1-acyl-sn-glycerol-3-phosphate acyltransferase
MIIKSKHHLFYYNWFRFFYGKWKIRQYFHEVILLGEYQEKNLPLLIICNHVSWWDGIWVMYLNIEVLKRKFHFMMLEEEIKKDKVPNYVGGYSIKKKSRSIIESINYTSELLTDNKNLVLLFPQGEIRSLYTPSIQFEKGFNNILKRIGSKVQIIFTVNLVDYFSNVKPTLYIYFKEYQNSTIDAEKMQNDFNSFYAESISGHLRKKESR